MPITRAIQRDEVAMAHWRTEAWPELKKQASHEGRMLVLMDESGFYLLPGVVKTYAPRGQTPVLREWNSKDHLPVMGAVTQQGKVFTLVRQEPLNGRHTIEFLEHLLRMTSKERARNNFPICLAADGRIAALPLVCVARYTALGTVERGIHATW